MTIDQLYSVYQQHPSVQTDTRKLRAGDIFFALKGENFNGNAFAKQALDAGAEYAVIDEASFEVPGRTILVPNVLEALQQLALHHRRQFSIPFLAITGSNGKTTTKELIHAVLSSRYRTSTTEGNLNNHIGIPLTILRIPADAEMAVIEMGANHQREIAGYCAYTEPTHGLITNVGLAHLEGFGGPEGVKKGKGELFDYLRQQEDGTVFIYSDYEYLQEMSLGVAQVVKYGTQGEGLFVKGQLLEADPFLQVELSDTEEKVMVKTQLVGAYNLPNVLAAAAVGLYFGVRLKEIASALEQYTPSNSRSQMLKWGEHHVILDAYNANPSSMRLAIENFARIQAPHKILLLGAMAELGRQSLDEHQAIINLISEYKWDTVALVGGDFLKINHPYLSFPDATRARDWWQQQHFPASHVLIKGSRSTKMETILNDSH
jgi:UDP-N-acetylmuramoyl-tripeptide--D-alanyl-D-alanine ligase